MTRVCRYTSALAVTLIATSLPLGSVSAQDTNKVNPEGVTVVLKFRPGEQPGMVMLPGAGADSARAMVGRDLDFSDRFRMIPVGDPATTDGPTGPINYGIYKTLGALFAVEIAESPGGITAKLHNVAQSRILNQQAFTLPPATDPAFRLEVHRLSDEIARWATGTPGAAASRLLFVSGGRVYRIDSDGSDLTPLTPADQTSLSPVPSPDGQQFAFTHFGAGRGGVEIQNLGTGALLPVPGTQSGLNITPAFSPDGRSVAYAHSDESGTDIYTANVADQCCTQRLTVGRYADNLSPTFSPDGRRIAFVSTRAGPAQIYVMAANGTDQELLAPFVFGVSGASNAPEWSPDGANVIFHREVDRSPQIFLVNVGRRTVRQYTSAGRNEDPTWAPDGRHFAFISDRSGVRQIWVMDTETGRVRQLHSPGAARLPSWSRRLGRTAAVPNP